MNTGRAVGIAAGAYLLVGVWRYMVARNDAAAARGRLAAVQPGPGLPAPSPASVPDPSPAIILFWPKQISGPFTG